MVNNFFYNILSFGCKTHRNLAIWCFRWLPSNNHRWRAERTHLHVPWRTFHFLNCKGRKMKNSWFFFYVKKKNTRNKELEIKILHLFLLNALIKFNKDNKKKFKNDIFMRNLLAPPVLVTCFFLARKKGMKIVKIRVIFLHK